MTRAKKKCAASVYEIKLFTIVDEERLKIERGKGKLFEAIEEKTKGKKGKGGGYKKKLISSFPPLHNNHPALSLSSPLLTTSCLLAMSPTHPQAPLPSPTS
jgi:hypothetical protein